MGQVSRSLPLERELVERVVVLLTTYANYGMEAFYANGERTPNSILADEVASKFSAVLAAHAPEPQPLTGEACARIYDEAKACARSEKPVEADYKIHETALVHVYAAGQRSIAAASETQRWIPIGESLPAIGKNVAILISDKSVAIEDWPTSGYLYPGVEWWAGVPGNYINLAGHKWNVTAWMPLPEAKK